MESENLTKWLAVGTLSVLIIGTAGIAYDTYKSSNKNSSQKTTQSKTSSTQNSTPNTDIAYIVNDIASAVNSPSAKKDYVVKSIDSTTIIKQNNTLKHLGSVTTPITTPKIVYGGIEVNSSEKFSNAKIIGLDYHNIEFLYGNKIASYTTKNILFELNNNKILSLIAPDDAFYLGQRYNISYYTFKKNEFVSATNILRMMLSTQETLNPTINAYIDKDYSNDYDGVLFNHELIKKDK
jgi:hypothetical protein